MQTKSKVIGYWAATGIVAAVFVGSGAFNAARPEPVLTLMAHLGYAPYFPLLLGIWKVLGGLAVLAPGLPRLKEWAYAGMFFDLTGAVVSQAASGAGPADVIPPAVLTIVLLASWALRPDSRKLGSIISSRVTSSAVASRHAMTVG